MLQDELEVNYCVNK